MERNLFDRKEEAAICLASSAEYELVNFDKCINVLKFYESRLSVEAIKEYIDVLKLKVNKSNFIEVDIFMNVLLKCYE